MASLIASYVFFFAFYLALALPTSVLLRGGVMSLSHSACAALGAFLAAGLATLPVQGEAGVLQLALIFAACVGLGTLTGFLFGAVALRGVGDSVLVITLLFVEIVERIGEMLPFAGGVTGAGVRRLESWDPTARAWLVATLSMAWAGLATVVARRIERSRLGSILDAIRHDDEVAQLTGLPVWRCRLGLFIWSGAVCGGAGCLYGAFVGYVAPAAFGLWPSIVVFVIALAGWRGGVPGVLLATGVLYALPELLRGFVFRIPIGIGQLESISLVDLWPLVFAVLLGATAWLRGPKKVVA